MGKTIENYSLQVLLGSGVYSQVYKAINTKTNEIVAIKMIKSDKFKELPKLQQGTVNEINILSTLKPCPYIIRYFDMLKTVNNFYFVYEYCNGGTLQQLLKKVQYLPQQQALIYFRQIMEAFKVLAKHNIMHRDLKPENILLHNDVIKIADFGFCKVLQNQQEMAQTMLGSPIYMAPEILKGETYTIKADIWSLGVVLFRMLFGYCPYQSSNIAKLIMLMENDQLVIPSQPGISPILAQLIARMLVKNPSNRADWNEVFSYQISENGYIRQIRDVSQSSGKSSFVNDWTTKASNSGHSRITNIDKSGTRQGGSSKIIRVRETVERPYNSKQQIEREGLQFEKQKSTRDQFSRNVRDRSPHPQHIGKTQIYARNHVKCLQLANLSVEIYGYQSQFSLSVAFLIGKQLEKQYDQIIESINLENNYDIYKLFSDQARELKYILSMYCQQLLQKQIDYYCLEDRYKQVIKQFANSLKLESLEETIMVERVLAWFDSKLIMKKEVYQKFSKQQLRRQINGKLAQF